MHIKHVQKVISGVAIIFIFTFVVSTAYWSLVLQKTQITIIDTLLTSTSVKQEAEFVSSTEATNDTPAISTAETKNQEQEITNSLIPPIIHTPNGWLAYTKEGLDYGFAYKSDWGVDEAFNQYTRISLNGSKVEIVRLPIKDLTLDTFIKKQQSLSEARVTVEDQKEMRIDGFPAVSMIERYGSIFSARAVYIQKNTNVYIILISLGGNESESDMQIFLNSFKFAQNS